VQIRNVYIYYLSKSKNQWILATGSNGMTGYYDAYTTTVNYTNITVNKRTETTANGGGTSIKLLPGYCFQGWTLGNVGAINANDIGGIWAYCEARLIVDNPSLPDDRGIANLVLCEGGDYKQLNATTIADIAIGRFKKLTNGWRPFNMSTLTDAQWAKAAAPPVNKFD
jgi:hypothetical protein